jgi:glycosyltransferase involved in cell wall biosynthesis
MTARVAVVTSGFPRTSETFAIGELAALARAGVLIRLYATKTGDGAPPQPGAGPLMPLVRRLPAGDAAHQATTVAAELASLGVDGIHGYFAHHPADVAARAAARLGVPYSFSAHALDARKVAPDELEARARAAVGVVVCNTDVATSAALSGAHVGLVPHGVDLRRFSPQPPGPRDGRLRLLAVGRLVEKKGFPVLLEAVSRLRTPWTLRIVGTGPQRRHLDGAISALGLDRAVELVGRLSHQQLPAEYARADVVVVPSVVDSSGDRDGLPNVVLEAMASGRAVVASDVAALGPAVRRAGGGLVVPPGQAGALAAALLAAADPARRERLGAAGREYVLAHHDLDTCTQRFVDHVTGLHAPATEPADA